VPRTWIRLQLKFADPVSVRGRRVLSWRMSGVRGGGWGPWMGNGLQLQGPIPVQLVESCTTGTGR